MQAVDEQQERALDEADAVIAVVLGKCRAIGARRDAATSTRCCALARAWPVAKLHGVKGTLGRHRLKCLGILVGGPSESPEAPETTVSEEPETHPKRAELDPEKLMKSLAETVSGMSRPLLSAPRPSGEVKPVEVVTAALEVKCVNLRLAGWEWDDIAEKLGVDWRTAVAMTERVLLRTRAKADRKAEQLRQLELRRCDAMLKALWDTATSPGDVPDGEVTTNYGAQEKAVKAILTIMERRAKYIQGRGLSLQSLPHRCRRRAARIPRPWSCGPARRRGRRGGSCCPGGVRCDGAAAASGRWARGRGRDGRRGRACRSRRLAPPRCGIILGDEQRDHEEQAQRDTGDHDVPDSSVYRGLRHRSTYRRETGSPW